MRPLAGHDHSLAGYFSDESSVKVANQNILTLNVDALAVLANSFGFTDGGVDMAISREVFDWRLQDTLHTQIEREHGDELLMGQVLVMSTDSSRFRYAVGRLGRYSTRRRSRGRR